jgi:hypothetical protein
MASPERSRRSSVARGRGIPLGEHEVDDGHHRLEPLGQLIGRWDAVRNARERDLLLRAHEALRHRGHRDEERARDLLRGEPREGAQRQRDLRLDAERRVAAREDEAEEVVAYGIVVALVGRADGRLVERDDGELAIEARPAADPIDRLVARGAKDPRPRLVRDPLGRPLRERRLERVVHGLLGELEVAAEEANEAREHARRRLAVRRRDLVPHRMLRGRAHDPPERSRSGESLERGRRRAHTFMMGRTSIEPNRAPGMRAASSRASSRSFASTR